MTTMALQRARLSRQQGVTLVELMVAVTIAMALVAAVSMLFLNTRLSQRSTDERSQMRETGLMVLDIIGRQISNAGYYPSINEELLNPGGAPMNGVLMGYESAVKIAEGGVVPVAVASGLHGCHQGVPKADLSGCDAPSATLGRANSDGITVAYFTDDALSHDVGWRSDCARHDIAGADVNAHRVSADLSTQVVGMSSGARTASSGMPPALPLLGVNQFFLQPVAVTDRPLNDAGKAVPTYELVCRGNGAKMSTLAITPGVEQLVLRYGVAKDAESMVPEQYMTADDVTTADAWNRVMTVKLCVMVRNLNAVTSRVSGVNAKDCLGQDVTDKTMVTETFTRTFSVKNRQSQTIRAALQ